jgi:methylenetetrahydrofolate dehydrogenase (NADP+)/methenyltetrahydrofolate cyclohydrolase
MPLLLDGKKVRDEICLKLKATIAELSQKNTQKGKKIALAIIQVGDNPESTTYIAQKKKFAETIGVHVEHIRFPGDTVQADIINKIVELNRNVSVQGILVQMPLPLPLDKDAIIEAIDPSKDVDGLTALNVKKLWSLAPMSLTSSVSAITHAQAGQISQVNLGTIGFFSATAAGVMTLLDYYKIPIEGRRVVIVGRSELVGKPLFFLLINRNATVTLCHSKTRDLADITRQADIVVVAVGKPGLITSAHVRPGQTVVDVGITVTDDVKNDDVKNIASPDDEDKQISQRKLLGDVDFEAVSKVLGAEGALSPVPGGVGPLTVACLFENLVRAAS